MRSKLVAAEMASTGGVGGRDRLRPPAPARWRRRRPAAPVGTRFRPDPRPLSAYKLWVRYGKPVHGASRAWTPGARRAVVGNGTSLLAVGLLAVEGAFAAGDAVHICAGRASRSRSASRATRPPTCGSWLGTRGVDEAVHRDNLVVL